MRQEKKNENGLSDFSWGYSSAGRAPALQAGGQEFEPPYLHQNIKERCYKNIVNKGKKLKYDRKTIIRQKI